MLVYVHTTHPGFWLLVCKAYKNALSVSSGTSWGTFVLDAEKGTLHAGVYPASFSDRSPVGRLVGMALTLEDLAVSVIQEVLTKQALRAAVLTGSQWPVWFDLQDLSSQALRLALCMFTLALGQVCKGMWGRGSVGKCWLCKHEDLISRIKMRTWSRISRTRKNWVQHVVVITALEAGTVKLSDPWCSLANQPSKALIFEFSEKELSQNLTQETRKTFRVDLWPPYIDTQKFTCTYPHNCVYTYTMVYIQLHMPTNTCKLTHKYIRIKLTEIPGSPSSLSLILWTVIHIPLKFTNQIPSPLVMLLAGRHLGSDEVMRVGDPMIGLVSSWGDVTLELTAVKTQWEQSPGSLDEALHWALSLNSLSSRPVRE